MGNADALRGTVDGEPSGERPTLDGAAVVGHWGGTCPRCGKRIATIALKTIDGTAACAVCVFREIETEYKQ